MRRIKKLNGIEVVVERAKSGDYDEIMSIVDAMTSAVDKKDFNIVLNAVSLFLCGICQMTSTSREEAEVILNNLTMSVLCRTYDIGDESPLQ